MAAALKGRFPAGQGSSVSSREEYDIICERAGWFKAVSAVVSVAEANNPRFNRRKFYEACGVNVDQYPE